MMILIVSYKSYNKKSVSLIIISQNIVSMIKISSVYEKWNLLYYHINGKLRIKTKEDVRQILSNDVGLLKTTGFILLTLSSYL